VTPSAILKDVVFPAVHVAQAY